MKKRKSLFIVFLLLFSSIFAGQWDVQEYPYDSYVFYVVTKAPEKYNNLIGSVVLSMVSRQNFRNMFDSSCKAGIIEFLEKEDFEIDQINNMDSPFLSKTFMEKYFPESLNVNIPVTKEDLNYIWKILSSKYGGFSEMKKRGLKEKKFYKTQNTSELKSLLDKYVEDCHFNLYIRDFSYYQEIAFDEGCKKSKDPDNIYFEKETSNAYYVRFTSCMDNPGYFDKLPLVANVAKDKDYIILDARSNKGGNGYPRQVLASNLNRQEYKGTVIVLQDNFSTSSGEVWSAFGIKDLKYKRLLVGTHSGGMQNYGECYIYKNEELNIEIYVAAKDYRKILPSNYLGEGKGYEPDIWATTETMKATLEGLGVDLTGIDFQ